LWLERLGSATHGQCGIVDQNVQSSEFFDARGYRCLHRFLVGDVEALPQCLVAQLLCQGRGAVAVEVTDDHPRACFQQCLAVAPPQQTRAAGDERHPPIQTEKVGYCRLFSHCCTGSGSLIRSIRRPSAEERNAASAIASTAAPCTPLAPMPPES